MEGGSALFFRVEEVAFGEGDLKMGFGGEPLRQVGGGRAVQGMNTKLESGGGAYLLLCSHSHLPLSAAGYNVTVAICMLKYHRQDSYAVTCRGDF